MDITGFSRTFKDALGREFTVTLTLANDDLVEAACGVSIINLVPSQTKKRKGASDDDFGLTPLGELLGDPYAVLAVVWALVEADAKARGIDRASFKSGLDEKTAVAMGFALQRALHDFFPMDPARQAILRRIATQGQKVMNKTADKMHQELERIDLGRVIDAMPGIDVEKVTAEAIAHVKRSAGNSPATSESTPAP